LANGIVPALAVALLILAPISPPISLAGEGWPALASTGSWALGVVIPNGASLLDGSRLNWSASSNLTVQLNLPRISQVDDTVYAIVSVMTRSGKVLQVAAGIYPGMSDWRVYVLYVMSPNSGSYIWVANDSLPSMLPGASVSLSIFWAEGGWRYSVWNLDSLEHSEGLITNDSSGSFRSGDQEVIALESYTVTDGVFATMGSMEATGILVDGSTVTGGWYILGGWDPLHNPLFVVGGQDPPSFASASMSNTSIEWVYSAAGQVTYVPSSGNAVEIFVAAAGAIVVAVVLLEIREKK